MTTIHDRLARAAASALRPFSQSVHGPHGDFLAFVDTRTEAGNNHQSRQLVIQLLAVDLPKVGELKDILLVNNAHWIVQETIPGVNGLALVYCQPALNIVPVRPLGYDYWTARHLHRGYFAGPDGDFWTGPGGVV